MRVATIISMLIVAETHLSTLACTLVYNPQGSSSQIVPSTTSMVHGGPSIALSTQQPAPSLAPEDYMGILRTWRTKLGLKALKHDQKLESNAMDTVVVSNGEMVHKLNDGTFAQVLAPDQKGRFEDVLVGGWLCEIPSLPGLGGICATKSEGWAYEGQTGHAEILTSDAYSKIGCAVHAGVRCCDLA